MLEKLRSIVGEAQVRTQEPMCLHTTFRVGGPANIMVTLEEDAQLTPVINLCKEAKLPYFILGNGSNLLVRDEGYKGVILKLGKNYETIRLWEPDSSAAIDEAKALPAEELPAEALPTEEQQLVGKENTVHLQVGAVAMLSQVCQRAAAEGLTGMEFAYGIPGTLGGALVMNAGAYGGEMKDIVESVTLYDIEEQCICTIPGEQMQFAYRDSLVKHRPAIILSAVLTLRPGDPEKIQEQMKELTEQRRKKQPLEYPSAGSTFKRPEGYFAGKLIEDAGMRGYRVGGAQVAEKHAGFVINYQDATAADILTLMRKVQENVQKEFGVQLEPEIIILPQS